jgi:hypothetical protein
MLAYAWCMSFHITATDDIALVVMTYLSGETDGAPPASPPANIHIPLPRHTKAPCVLADCHNMPPCGFFCTGASVWPSGAPNPASSYRVRLLTRAISQILRGVIVHALRKTNKSALSWFCPIDVPLFHLLGNWNGV